jgi:hypothetical protein
MPRPLEWDIGVQIASVMDDQGFEDVQYDAEGEGASGASPIERHHFYGLWGRALDPALNTAPPGKPGNGQPDPTKGAQLLYAYEGSQGHAWTMEDPRVLAIIPIPDPGCAVFYGVNPTAGASSDILGCSFVRTHSDGRISLATTSTGGGGDGQTIFEEVSRYGFVRASPWGREMFGQFADDNGDVLFTGYSMQAGGGARFTLGYMGGILPGLGSTASLQADMVRVVAPVISIGPTGSVVGPVAQAEPLVGVLGAMGALAAAQSAAIVALQAEIVKLGGGSGSAGPVAALAALLGTAESAIGTALETIATATNIG